VLSVFSQFFNFHLNQKELSIEKIAETLGYQDPSNFTRAFKRWAHVSPSLYRKQNA